MTIFFQVYIGRVHYLDYDLDQFQDGNTFIPFLHKRKSFEQEQELRAILQPIYPGGDALTELEQSAEGMFVNIDLLTLIEAVFITPNAPDSFAVTVVDLAKKFNVAVPVRPSDLVRKPLF